MIEICESSITKPLQLLFNNSVKQGVFPDIWKMPNVLPMHTKEKKNSKQYHYYQFVQKYLESWYLIVFMSF